jgi:hypothetical protein
MENTTTFIEIFRDFYQYTGNGKLTKWALRPRWDKMTRPWWCRPGGHGE